MIADKRNAKQDEYNYNKMELDQLFQKDVILLISFLNNDSYQIYKN